MASELYIEETVVASIIAFLQVQLPICVAEINATHAADDQVQDVVLWVPDMCDITIMDPLPAASVFVEESEDEARDRTMVLNTCICRVLIGYYGNSNIGYRLAAAVTSSILRDITLGCRVGRVKVRKRVFYPPVVIDGDLEVRAVEVYLEVSQEVKRL